VQLVEGVGGVGGVGGVFEQVPSELNI